MTETGGSLKGEHVQGILKYFSRRIEIFFSTAQVEQIFESLIGVDERYSKNISQKIFRSFWEILADV